MSSIDRPTTLTTLVAERLRADILSGELGSGAHLRQNEVANSYGVSSTPVREAFAVLERDGLVTVNPHRGVTVVEPTIDDIQEIYEMRMRLECLAVELACENPDADLEPTREAMLALDALETGDPAGFELNRTFHAELYALAQRPRLARAIADLRDASRIYMTLLFHLVSSTDATGNADEEHRLIFEALERRDARAASEAMAQHLSSTRQSIEQIFEEGQAVER